MKVGDISQDQVFWSPGPNGGRRPAPVVTPGTPVGPEGGVVDVPGTVGDGRPDYQAIVAQNGGVPHFYGNDDVAMALNFDSPLKPDLTPEPVNLVLYPVAVLRPQRLDFSKTN